MREPFGISQHIPNRIIMGPCNLKLIRGSEHSVARYHHIGFKEGV